MQSQYSRYPMLPFSSDFSTGYSDTLSVCLPVFFVFRFVCLSVCLLICWLWNYSFFGWARSTFISKKYIDMTHKLFWMHHYCTLFFSDCTFSLFRVSFQQLFFPLGLKDFGMTVPISEITLLGFCRLPRLAKYRALSEFFGSMERFVEKLNIC